MANWIVRRGTDWQERVRGWLDKTDLHAWVVQRELADPVSYVSLWTSDAGEAPEEAARRGGQWLDWFAEQDIAGIGMGLITLRAKRSGEHRPADRVLEEITAADEVGRALFAGCRGEVPLGTLIELLAGAHGVDAGMLAAAALPVVREAIGRGILHEAR